ncbi:uncharacterized protein LOC143231620 [Tachypleus tridentatus]|uniref:uncharacterized protein LOC143231620 n=1 Tax=Tachypleus tridentatus TaxID=6853 RepID=UPI003FCF4538
MTVPTSVEEVVIQPIPDEDCQGSRADSFQNVSVHFLFHEGQTCWYSVSRGGVQVFPSGLKTVATQTESSNNRFCLWYCHKTSDKCTKCPAAQILRPSDVM